MKSTRGPEKALDLFVLDMALSLGPLLSHSQGYREPLQQPGLARMLRSRMEYKSIHINGNKLISEVFVVPTGAPREETPVALSADGNRSAHTKT